MKYEISQDRHRLTFTVAAEEQKLLRLLSEEDPDGFCSDNTMYEWFEGLTCNSDLYWIPEDVTDDLTSAPMLGIESREMTEQQIKEASIQYYGLIDAGFCDGAQQYLPVLERWAYEPYQIRSPLQDLRDHGCCVFIDGF